MKLTKGQARVSNYCILVVNAIRPFHELLAFLPNKPPFATTQRETKLRATDLDYRSRPLNLDIGYDRKSFIVQATGCFEMWEPIYVCRDFGLKLSKD
jgi:hypothetical protein